MCGLNQWDLYLICLKNPRNTRKTKKDLVIGALI